MRAVGRRIDNAEVAAAQLSRHLENCNFLLHSDRQPLLSCAFSANDVLPGMRLTDARPQCAMEVFYCQVARCVRTMHHIRGARRYLEANKIGDTMHTEIIDVNQSRRHFDNSIEWTFGLPSHLAETPSVASPLQSHI